MTVSGLPYCVYKSADTGICLTGQSHEKVGEMRVKGDSLGPN
jgi:hypothetical protein